MRLRLWRKRPAVAQSEATQARIQAERDLAAVKAETPKYRALAAAFIEIQRTNHLGQTAARVLRGEK